LPTFLIVGTQRGGTTSLHRALAAHPGVTPPMAHKGVHYFDVDYGKGEAWYRAHWPLRRTAWRAARAAGMDRVEVFESSPYYMFHPAVAARIAADLPGARVIAVLRDPVERAYSQYVHEKARGYETAETFELALELESERLAGEEERLLREPTYVSHAHQHLGYLARSSYGVQLQRLAGSLGRDQVLVLDNGDLAERPEETIERVLGFLALPPAPGLRVGHHNARPRDDMDPHLRAELVRRMADSNAIVADFLAAEPSWLR